MPTPVGPVPPSEDDPDTWDWGEFDRQRYARKPVWQIVLVCLVVVGLVGLIVANII